MASGPLRPTAAIVLIAVLGEVLSRGQVREDGSRNGQGDGQAEAEGRWRILLER